MSNLASLIGAMPLPFNTKSEENPNAPSRPGPSAGPRKAEALPGAGAAKWPCPLFWAVLTLILDLGSKALAMRLLNPWEPLNVIPGFFNFFLTENTGAAFSLFSSDAGEGQGLKMAALAAVSLLPFIYFYVKAKAGDRLLLSGIGLIWGGALGNIHDRIRWGAVIDFLDFYLGGNHWPAFNVADIAICLGAGLLALSVIKEK